MRPKKRNYASVWTNLKCLAWICCETAHVFSNSMRNKYLESCFRVTMRLIMSWRWAGRSGVTLWLPTAVTVWVDGFMRDCSPESLRGRERCPYLIYMLTCRKQSTVSSCLYKPGVELQDERKCQLASWAKGFQWNWRLVPLFVTEGAIAQICDVGI